MIGESAGNLPLRKMPFCASRPPLPPVYRMSLSLENLARLAIRPPAPTFAWRMGERLPIGAAPSPRSTSAKAIHHDQVSTESKKAGQSRKSETRRRAGCAADAGSGGKDGRDKTQDELNDPARVAPPISGWSSKMSKEKNRGNRETKKPKKAKEKSVASSKHPQQSAVSQMFGRKAATPTKGK